jgi:hypothetical protein
MTVQVMNKLMDFIQQNIYEYQDGWQRAQESNTKIEILLAEGFV